LVVVAVVVEIVVETAVEIVAELAVEIEVELEFQLAVFEIVTIGAEAATRGFARGLAWRLDFC
jgi:hypothetical protein